MYQGTITSGGYCPHCGRCPYCGGGGNYPFNYPYVWFGTTTPQTQCGGGICPQTGGATPTPPNPLSGQTNTQ